MAKKKRSIGEMILTSKPALIIISLVVILAVAGIADTALTGGRVYGNVSINGIDMAGKDRPEIIQTLKETYGPRISHAEVIIYSTPEGKEHAIAALENAVSIMQQGDTDISIYGDEAAEPDYWITDALTLKASLPYEKVADEALAVGREDGGILSRMSLTMVPVDIEMNMNFGSSELDNLVSTIDHAIGDPRIDATVEIVNAVAHPVEGHDGMMINVDELKDQLQDAFMDDANNGFIQVKTENAPSRITTDQVNAMCDSLNHALGSEAQFAYKNKKWTATDVDLGNWTRVDVVAEDSKYVLQASIDVDIAAPEIADGANAHVSAEDTTVTFEDVGDTIMVHTSGSGQIPEIPAAVQELDEALYGSNGIAWSSRLPELIKIEIGESDRPETLTLDQAVKLGVVTIIGEYTTEFSNYVGTENRNHNIKLVSDLLNNSIIDAKGGVWSFNDRSGDTNEAAGFWSAGSIVEGELVDSIGGGICQVATTIFNAVYEAGLKVNERHNHTLYLSNYPDGRDAGVNYPDLDLAWENDLDSDILLTVTYTDDSVTARLYSIYTGYSTETEVGDWEEGEKYKVIFKESDDLAKGSYYRKTAGEDGREISVSRTVKDKDDKTIRTDLFESIYDPVDEVYAVGPGTDTSTEEFQALKVRDDDAS